jgi:periplasmic protein TonB
MKISIQLRQPLFWMSTAVLAVVIAGCASAPLPPPPPPAPRPVAPPPPPPAAAVKPPAPVVVAPPAVTSAAASAKDFRKDAAKHIYARNSAKIWKGKLQPLLYAVGVFEVEIDGRGNVVSTNWLRAPSHAPEVMAEINRLVREASPFPAPVRLGKVTYTDTWLWDKSGRFQLDTLSEGQL